MSNSIKWKYKETLKDDNVFLEVEKLTGLKISKTLKRLVQEANGATPNKCRIMIGNTENVFAGVLSFNKDEDDITVFTAIESIRKKKIIPFGIDPFGNLFCVKSFDVVTFWNHETNKFISTKMSLSTFLENLY